MLLVQLGRVEGLVVKLGTAFQVDGRRLDGLARDAGWELGWQLIR